MKVRMLRHIDQDVEVRELKMGQVYDIADIARAQQFIINGMAEAVEDDAGMELEAAALRSRGGADRRPHECWTTRR